MKATKDQISGLDRLQKRSDFLRVQKTGKRWVAKGLILQAAPAEGSPAGHGAADGPMRYGLTASKQLSRRAVDRNRIRRRLRAVACDVLPGTAKAGADYVLIGRAETATRPYDELVRDLRWCLRRLEFSREEAAAGDQPSDIKL